MQPKYWQPVYQMDENYYYSSNIDLKSWTIDNIDTKKMQVEKYKVLLLWIWKNYID